MTHPYATRRVDRFPEDTGGIDPPVVEASFSGGPRDADVAR